MIEQPPAIVIQDDRGGSLGQYLDAAVRAQKLHAYVKLDGDCLSACTLIPLMQPRDHVCITLQARLGFHKPSEVMGISFDDVLLNHYPPIIRNWLEHDGGLTHELKYLGYPELKTLYKSCP